MLGLGALGFLALTVASHPLAGSRLQFFAIPSVVFAASLAHSLSIGLAVAACPIAFVPLPLGCVVQREVGIAVGAVESLAVHPAAGATHTFATFGDVKIPAREQMATLAPRLTRVSRRSPNAAEQVLSHRHGFQVLRINTPTIAAQVVNGQPLRNRTDELLVAETVGGSSVRLAAASQSEAERAIATVCDSAVPVPAARPLADPKLGAEALGKSTEIHLATFCAVERPDRHLDDRGMGQPEALAQPQDDPEAFAAQSITGRELLSHIGNIPRDAVGVK